MEPEQVRLVKLQRDKRNPLRMRDGHIHYFYCDNGFTHKYPLKNLANCATFVYHLHSHSSWFAALLEVSIMFNGINITFFSQGDRKHISVFQELWMICEFIM